MLLPNRILYPSLFIALAGRWGYILFYADDKAHNFRLLALSLIISSGVFLLLYIASNGRWIGFGDVRLGLVTGTLIADPTNAFLMIFLASVLGTLFVLPDLARSKKTTASKIPFGPFLITASLLVVLFGTEISDWYQRVFLP